MTASFAKSLRNSRLAVCVTVFSSIKTKEGGFF